jgi:hypothetical protein
MLSVAPVVTAHTWEQKLGSYRKELVCRVALLIIVGLANITLITYTGYHLYKIIPFSWTKAIVYTPLIAGFVLTLIVYKKILQKSTKEDLPRGINERNISYYNPLLVISSILSFGLLLPSVLTASLTDLTNYAYTPHAEATSSRLRNHSFQNIAFEEGARYKTLIRLGFIQETDSRGNELTLDDFTFSKGVLKPNGKQLSVRKWIKKARNTLHELQTQLEDAEIKQKEAPNSDKIKETVLHLQKSIEDLDGLWQQRAQDICPVYLGEIDYKLTWFQRNFLRNSLETKSASPRAEKKREASTPTSATSHSFIAQSNFSFV